MKVKQIELYETEDGKRFESREAAEIHAAVVAADGAIEEHLDWLELEGRARAGRRNVILAWLRWNEAGCPVFEPSDYEEEDEPVPSEAAD